jgi:hypothetical protein
MCHDGWSKVDSSAGGVARLQQATMRGEGQPWIGSGPAPDGACAQSSTWQGGWPNMLEHAS